MSRYKIFLKFFSIVIFLFAGCSVSQPTPLEIVSADSVHWEPLNPARGDKSPKAAILWGDRGGSSPTGFLVKFVDGFASPPHIHNVSYRGVVIDGLIHNDDPDAARMWMPKGSYWTQPKGETHITAAKGTTNVAYIEIDEGPYLVRPPKDSFDSGERPVNVVPSNLVWHDLVVSSAVKVAFLWGEPKEKQLNGTLVELQPGFTGLMRSSSSLRAVAIQGRYWLNSSRDVVLTPGSYFSSAEAATHRVSCEASTSCIFYVRARGKYTVTAG